MRLALSLGSGLAITSVLLFFWLLIFDGNTEYYTVFELLAGLIAFFLPKRVKALSEAKLERESDNFCDKRTIYFFFGALFLLLTLSILQISLHTPHGNWDAWSIWNVRARFIFRAGENWKTAFSDKMPFSHPDYPLLIPLTVVRGWIYARQETLTSQIATSIIFSALVFLMLFNGVFATRGGIAAFLAAATLASTPYFLQMSASQYADLPLAFFFLATFLLIAINLRQPSTSLMIFAGMNAGFAAWTKNEGLLFSVVMLLVVIILALKTRTRSPASHSVGGFVFGLLLMMIPVAVFKLSLAPANYITKELSPGILSQMVDLERLSIILKHMVVSATNFGLWNQMSKGFFNPIPIMFAYLLWAGVKLKSTENWLFPAVLLTMLGGYVIAYMASPHELTWHLNSSSNRLFLQLWPAAIFTFFLLAPKSADITDNHE